MSAPGNEDLSARSVLHTLLSMGPGRLKVYLGWAPGVGKSRRALLDLATLKKRGIVPVIGWLEDKGREEIRILAGEFRSVPPREVVVAGKSFREMDVEAILRESPPIVFVDELARDNPPVSGRLSRWEEVGRLLESGISVVTTLNAMHVHELAPTVSRLLERPVEVTLPLDFLRKADEIVVVDIPPAELRERIRKGLVFPPEQIDRALKGPYREPNLVRLRELTLDFAARVLDAQLVRQGGKKGVYERVLVLVSDHPEAFKSLLGYGGALSRRLGGELLVLHLRKISLLGKRPPLDRTVLEEMQQAVRENGGKMSVLWTRNFAWTLWRFIQKTGTTRLIMGHAGRVRPWRKSLVRNVLRYFPRIDVEILLLPSLVDLPPVPEPGGGEIPVPEREEGGGTFTLFLGAAAGIGKTYRMLAEAQHLLREGVNLVVGYLETHRRPETEKMATGLPFLPRIPVYYHGLVLEEMDLDGILARRPRLVLVDELAHSNPPGFRNPKRYQDVFEILSAGIDVFSTLNVQHLETLNDLIEFQTGIRVHETVPDSVLMRVDSLVLVDLTPEALQARLMEGNVYPPEKVQEALDNFFTKSNLTALRELAMRQVAETGRFRLMIRGRGGILLVGVSDRLEDGALIRRGATLSERLGLSMVVLSITSGHTVPRWRNELESLTRTLSGTFSEESSDRWEEFFVERCRALRPGLVLLGQSAWRPGMESTAEKIARNLTDTPLLIIPLNIREHRKEVFG
jgi:two-component system sensor histidine kinase KdpD